MFLLPLSLETFLSAISDLAHERDSILCCRWTGRQNSRQREPAFKIVCDVTTLYKIRILGGRYCQLPILRFLLHFHSFLSFVLLAQSLHRLCDWSNFASSFSICYPLFFLSFFFFYLLDIPKIKMIKSNARHSSLLKLLTRPPLWKRLSTRRRDGETHELNRAYACKSWIVWNVSSKNGLENCVSKYRIKVQRCVNRHCKRFRASI